jgi:hypothetical protein
MANKRPVTFEVKKCSKCGGPATMTCSDCGNPVCGGCVKILTQRDSQYRCDGCFTVYVKKHGSGIK